jgi:predicted transcriptional regulator
MKSNNFKGSVQSTSENNFEMKLKTRRFGNRGGVIRRSRIERYLDILKVVGRHGPIKQTHIMYKANLSWMELKRNLEHLVQLKMISEVNDSSGLLYAISETGLATIYNYEKVEKTLVGNEESIGMTGNIRPTIPQWNF